MQAGNPEFVKQLLESGNPVPDIKGFGLSPGWALFIMTWDNILKMFIAPWAGAKSDRTWNRFGRRKGWILLGAPIALLGFIFIPIAQSVLAIATFIVITDIGMAIFLAPTAAWLGDIFKPDERSKASGIINLVGGIGALLAYFGGGIIFNRFGSSAPFVASSVAMVVALGVALFFVKEPKEVVINQEKDNFRLVDNLKLVFRNHDKRGLRVLIGVLLWSMAFAALESGLSSFAVFTLGISAGTASMYAGSLSLAFLVSAVPAGFVGARLGRAKTIRLGLVIVGSLWLGGYFFVRDTTSLLIMLILTGVFWSLVVINALPLVYDYGDEKRIGVYTGLFLFSMQLAAVLGPTLGGVVVDVLENQYRWLLLFSATLLALAWVSMSGVKKEKSEKILKA